MGYGSQTGVPGRGLPHQLQPQSGRRESGSLGDHAAVVPARPLERGAGAATRRRCRCCAPCRPASTTARKLTDDLSVQYGFTLNSVSFLDHLNYASPYARVTYSLGDAGELEFAYTSGDARPDLAGEGDRMPTCSSELNTLGIVPAHQPARRPAADPARREFRADLLAQDRLAHLPDVRLPRERQQRGAFVGGAGGNVQRRRYSAGSLHRHFHLQRRRLSQFRLYRGGDAGSRPERERHRDVRIDGRAVGRQSRDRQQQSGRIAIDDSRRTPHGRHGARDGHRAVDRHALDRQLPGDRRPSLGIARTTATARRRCARCRV